MRTRRDALGLAGRGGLAALAAAAGAPVAAGCSPGRRPVRELALGTGPKGGPFNAFGHAFAAAVADSVPSLRVEPVATSASVDNLHRLDQGKLALALTTADVAEDAVLGRHTFSRPLKVTALARIYVNYTHLVTRADGPVTSVAKLADEPVAVGAQGSGAHVIAMRLLEIAGLVGATSMVRRPMTLLESVAALRDGRVRALFWSGGVPTPALSNLSRDLPLRLLALDTYVEPMRRAYGPVYTAVTIPAGPYGLHLPVPTIGTGNYLAARPEMPKDVVYQLMRVLFKRRDDVLRPVTAGARLEPKFAISTGAVPLHAGAVAYYRSVYN